MKKIALLFLLLCAPAFAQVADVSGSAPLTSTCSNANTSCDTAGVTNFTFGQNAFSVLGPQTIEGATLSYGLAQVTASGTYSGSTLNFEYSDDGGTTWYPETCTRGDTNLQEISEVIPTNAFRGWECGVGAATKFRVRQSAISTGGPRVNVTFTGGLVEPAPTVQLSINGVSGSNPCFNPHAALIANSMTTAGTSLVQIVPLAAGTRIYVCSLSVEGQSGTTPTFSLEYGTGIACATSPSVLIPAFATPANTLLAFANPVTLTPAGQALCYIQTGTSPVSVFALTYIQQ